MIILPSNDTPLPTDLSNGDADVAVAIGTSFHDYAMDLLHGSNAVIVFVDVVHELNKLVVPPEMKGRVILLPVGDHKTIQQLVEKHGTEAQKEALKGLPAISTNDGLAQVASGGTAAMLDLLVRTTVKEWLRDVVPELIKRAGGHVPQIRLATYAGSAGGVASQGAITFLNGFLDILLDSGIMSVDIAIHLIGGISFVGKGFQRSQKNAVSSLITWVKRFQTPVDASVTFSLYAFEAIPFGDDRKARSDMISYEQTGLTAFDVKERIRQDRSNRAADGPLGNIVLIRVTYYQAISSEQKRNDVASQYLPELERLSKTAASRSKIVVLRFEYVDSRQKSIPAEELLDQLLRIDEPEAIFDIVDPGPSYDSAEPIVELLDESHLPLSKLGELYSALPPTPESCSQRLSLLMAIRERSVEELMELLNAEAELQLSHDIASEDLLKAREHFESPPWWLFWKGDERRADDLCFAVDHYRDCLIACREVSNEVHMLETAISESERLIDQNLERLNVLIQLIKRQVSYQNTVSRTPMVVAQPLAKKFSSLMEAAFLGAAQDQPLSGVLERCIHSVTRFGLQSIVGAPDDSLDGVVSAVRSGHAAVNGPEWGGQEPRQEAVSFVVYPKVLEHERKPLAGLHKAAEPGVQIAFANEMAPSCNVIRLRLVYCRELSDLLSPHYQAALKKVLADPATALYLPDKSILTDVGIDIEPPSASSESKDSK